MEFLSNLNFEQLGTAGLIVGILLWQNYELRKEIRELQGQLREVNQLFQGALRQNIEAFRDLREMIAVLKDRK